MQIDVWDDDTVRRDVDALSLLQRFLAEEAAFEAWTDDCLQELQSGAKREFLSCK